MSTATEPTLTVETTEGTYTVRDCGSDRKPWLVERTGYTSPLAAFHDQQAAETYCRKAVARRGLRARTRAADLDHWCPGCNGWTEAWDDGSAGVWCACQCGAGYVDRALVQRIAAGPLVQT